MRTAITLAPIATFIACTSTLAAPQLSLLNDPVEIVRGGDSAPKALFGTNGRFQSFGSVQLNNSAEILFSARLYDTDGERMDDSAIYRIGVPAPNAGAVLNPLLEVMREGNEYLIDDHPRRVADLFTSADYRLQDWRRSDPVGGVLRPRAAIAVNVGVFDPNERIVASQDTQGNWQRVAGSRDPLPNGDGELRDPGIGTAFGPSGRLTFVSRLLNTPGGDTDDVGVYRHTPGETLVEIAREGSLLGNGIELTEISTVFLQSSLAASATFPAFDDSGDPETDLGVYLADPVSNFITRIVGEGDPAPSPENEAFRFERISDTRLNIHNRIGFTGELRGESSTPSSGLYVASRSSEIIEVVREGQLAPDGSATFLRFRSGDVGQPSFNDLDQFAFWARVGTGVQSPPRAVFRASASEVIELAREGENYEGGMLQTLRNPGLNNEGLVLIEGVLNLGTMPGPDPDDGDNVILEDVLILTDGVDYATVARAGQEVSSQTIGSIDRFYINDYGTIIVQVRYREGPSAILKWRPRLGWRSAAGDGPWDDPTNWSFSQVPGLDSNVVVDAASDVRVEGPGADVWINSLWLGHGAGQVTFALHEGSIATSEGLIIGPNGILAIADNNIAALSGPVINDGVIQIGDKGQLVLEHLLGGSGQVTGTNGTLVMEGGIAPGS